MSRRVHGHGGGKTKLILSGTPQNVAMTGDGTYIRQ
jgi:hypothetical protein